MSPTLCSPPPHQVFISVDDLEPPKPPGTEDPRVEPEGDAGAGAPGTAAVEQQQSVEFDSPDSGLPSSRNYSVASGIQSSIDEGPSVGFEEEDCGGEEGSDGPVPSVHAFSEPRDPSQEKASEAGEELAAVCTSAYTVCGCSPGPVLRGPQSHPAIPRHGHRLEGGRRGAPTVLEGPKPVSASPED